MLSFFCELMRTWMELVTSLDSICMFVIVPRVYVHLLVFLTYYSSFPCLPVNFVIVSWWVNLAFTLHVVGIDCYVNIPCKM